MLQVMATLDRGGAEAVVVEWLRKIDRQIVAFDFVVNENSERYALEEEVLALGATVIRAPRFKGWNLLQYALWWRRVLVRNPQWEIVHAHHTVPACVYLLVARLCGRVTIAHSHNAAKGRTAAALTRSALRWPIRHIATLRLACSGDAGSAMFGKKAQVFVVANGVDADRFEYSEARRTRARADLGVSPDTLLVGHVGSFRAEKNHTRLLSIFAEITRIAPTAQLILVGDGALRPEISGRISDLHMQEKVSMVGIRDDVPDLLSAMDIMLFPSHSEGLGVALIEGQVAGLPCVISDIIPEEVLITDLVEPLPLAESDLVWAAVAVRKVSVLERRSHAIDVRAAGYDSAHSVRVIQELYTNLSHRSDQSGEQL